MAAAKTINLAPPPDASFSIFSVFTFRKIDFLKCLEFHGKAERNSLCPVPNSRTISTTTAINLLNGFLLSVSVSGRSWKFLLKKKILHVQ